MSVLQYHILNAPDVCSNCFSLVRRERVQTKTTDPKSHASVEKSAYTRVKHTTEVDHTPDGPTTDSIAVFCECGVQSAFEHIIEDADHCVTMARFKTLLKDALYSLEAKGVTVKRRTAIMLAIQHYRDHNDIIDALESGIEAGVSSSPGHSDDTTEALAD